MKYSQNIAPNANQLTIFIAIIGTADPARHIIASNGRREALDGLIQYVNLMMDSEVVPQGASETDVFKAIADNLYQPTAIVEVELHSPPPSLPPFS